MDSDQFARLIEAIKNLESAIRMSALCVTISLLGVTLAIRCKKRGEK